MIPIVRFTDAESFLNYIGCDEISQANNLNAYTRLYINNNERVTKLFVDEPVLTRKNLDNVRFLYDRDDLRVLSPLVLPDSLVEFMGKIVGYTMPYVPGVSLHTALHDCNVSYSKKIRWFSDLAKLICDLPSDIHIGDLHGNNVRIDCIGNIKLIDIDGFSIDGLHQMTCPLNFCPASSLPRKYYAIDGSIKVSKNSDVLCLFMLFFSFILNGVDYFLFTKQYKEMYLRFLQVRGVSENFIAPVKTLLTAGTNFLSPNVFDDFFDISSISFSDFKAENEFQRQELEAERRIEEYMHQ